MQLKKIKLYYGEPVNIPVIFSSNPLVRWGKTLDDIENISMNLKKNPNIDADDKYLLKKLKNDQGVTLGEVIFDKPNIRFVMVINENDYTKIIPDQNYELILALKVTGFNKYIEMKLNDTTKIIHISKDINRE